MFALDLFNTPYERALKEGAVDKVVSEGGPYDLPGIDYDRPGDAPRRPRPLSSSTPRRHPDDPDFMDPDQRRLRADQERVRKANAEYHAKKKSGVAEGNGRDLTNTPRDQFISRMTPSMDANALRQKVAKIVNSPGFTEDTILQIVDAGDNLSHPAGRYIQQAFYGLQYNLGKEYEDYPERVAEKLLSQFRSMLPAYRVAEATTDMPFGGISLNYTGDPSDKPQQYHYSTEPKQSDKEKRQQRLLDVRSRKQDLLSDYAQLGALRVEMIYGINNDVFLNKEQLLDYFDHLVDDPALTPLEYAHENGIPIDGLLKGMLRRAAQLGIGALDVRKLWNSAKDKVKAKPGVAESAGQDRKAWMASIRQQHPTVKFVQAKMPGAPIMALVNGKPVAQWDSKTGVAEGDNNSTHGMDRYVKPVRPGEINKALQKGIDQRKAARERMQANVANLPTHPKKGMAEGSESEYDIRQMLDKHDRDVEDLGIVGQGEHWAGIQQAKQRRVEKQKEQKKRKAVDEETDPFGGYKQSPRAFGVGNFQRIVRANMGNLPTVTLEFADPNDNIVLDKKGIDLISDYYDGLKTDAIKNHFIYRVLPSEDEVLTILKRLGWHDAVQPELPGIPRQGELPLQEKKRLDRNTDVPAGDVKVARELQKLRAQYPAARSDVEVVAKSEIDSNERSQQQLAAIKGANNEQDRLLQQLVALDRKQGTEIGSLDNENDRLEQQLSQVKRTNAQLAQAIGQMSGRAQSVSPQSRVVDILPNAPADAPSQPQSQAAAEPTEPVQRSKSDAIGRMAQSLGQTRQVRGIDQGPAPSIRGDNVSYIDPVRRAQAAIAKKDLGPMAKRMIDKGVLTRTGTDEGLLDFVTKKQSATKTKPEPVDPMLAKIVSNRQNPQSRVPRAKAKVYHGWEEYNRAKAVGDVEETAVNEFAPAGGGGSGNYFQELASAWYNGTFDSGSLQKGIKSQQDVERLLNRGIVCPDGVTRKLHIDYNSDFDGVEIYSDDYYEHGDLDGNDGRTGQPWGPYDFMAFSDDDLSESLTELSTDKLAQYKTAAALDAGASDKRGDYERGDKRFAGIIKATKKQFANDLKKHGQQGVAEGSGTASDAVERAILNRIMTQHTNLLMKFGPDKVMQAVEEVAYNVGDVDEIGTSDVSAYVNQVRQILGAQ